MHYYEIFAAAKNNLNRGLIYTHSAALAPYQIIKAPLLKQTLPGFVGREIAPKDVPKNLKTKCRDLEAVSSYCLPKPLVTALFNLAQHSSLTSSGVAKLALANALFKSRPLRDIKPKSARSPALTSAQEQIYQSIKNQTTSQAQLLLGVNGAGKTRIYAELIKEHWQNNRSSLILVPEIGLSAQVIELLRDYLSLPIYHFHSALPTKERKDIWLRCQTHEPLIVVGPRSTEFLPLKNIGLIILDEFHDDSFKQESQPIYDSLQMASFLAKSHQAQLLCGSATPKISDYYHFQKAGYPIHHLKQRALMHSVKPKIIIVDKKDHKDVFSKPALEALTATLKRQHQALVFYNRRGHWRRVQCYQCLWQALCAKCERALIFHQDQFKLICHICRQKQTPLSVCPKCRGSISYHNPGLKAITEQLQKHLLTLNLKAPVWRFDSDNLKTENLASRLAEIKQQKGLILLGTQVVGQGLDLPNLETVVVLDAEQNLVSADYHGDEKHYRQIHQLSGRVGRGHLKGTQIIVQTKNPQSPILEAALKQDWLAFYEEEIKRRRKYRLPPFVHFGTLAIRQNTLEATKKSSLKIKADLENQFPKLQFYAPMPAENEKHARGWQWLLVVESRSRKDLVALAQHLKNAGLCLNLDPKQLFRTGD